MDPQVRRMDDAGVARVRPHRDCAGAEQVRDDETLPAIKKRIDSFHEFTEPVIDYYRAKGQLEEVDGEMSVEDIFAKICKRLEARKELQEQEK